MCALLPLILCPRAEPCAYFYVKWMFFPGSAPCLAAINAPLTDQLLHNGTVPTLHVCSPHEDTGDCVPTCMERCRVSTVPRRQSSTKPSHTENRKTETLLCMVTRCTVPKEVHTKLPRAPPNACLLVLVWVHFPLLVHTLRPHTSCDKTQNYEHNTKCWKIVFISTQFT